MEYSIDKKLFNTRQSFCARSGAPCGSGVHVDCAHLILCDIGGVININYLVNMYLALSSFAAMKDKDGCL